MEPGTTISEENCFAPSLLKISDRSIFKELKSDNPHTGLYYTLSGMKEICVRLAMKYSINYLKIYSVVQ